MFNATKVAAMAIAGTQAVNISSQAQTSLSATVNEGAFEVADMASDHGMLAQTYAQWFNRTRESVRRA